MNRNESLHHQQQEHRAITRRHLFGRTATGIGSLALASLLHRDGLASPSAINPLAAKPTHFPAKAKRIIYLFMAGGPSQLELFDYKPKLAELSGKAPTAEMLQGKRFAFLKGNETLLGPTRSFGTYGQCGATLSDLIPHHRKIVDDICQIKTMQTDVFNHGPAKIFMNTGSAQTGRPSMGSWLSYGIGSESDSLPGFVVLQSGPRGPRNGAQLWSSGFLPSTYQGVPFRKGASPILNLQTPDGIGGMDGQRAFVDAAGDLNRLHHHHVGDPEIETRIAAYEMAYRMQTSAPELMSIQDETQETLDLYGVEVGKPSYAANCLLARRLIERDVRFVQLYHTNWDHHGGGGENIQTDLPKRTEEIDRATTALILDLKRLGLLEDTLVIWGGEFGRTPMGEVRQSVGRDHHIDAFTVWMAGAGVKPGFIYGETDELGFAPTENPVHVHDLHATILHLMGIDHERLTYRFMGRDFRLTDVHGNVVHDILS
ncbi:DUF1501 domain-containing protein [Stieleria varia]|uniref:Sulfatase n=1 Tax=Stieleria varia TaxID=2528005 RepID=A0A5C5ZYS8_9BACT|nr:DUF1501 domain-containing protein [Stieleria varia]TWT92429.1 hypothetical protein Pla52n_63030 [Stieleria varia]